MTARSYLRLAIARLDQCEKFLQNIPNYEADVAKVIVKTREAKQAALEAIEPLLVKCGTHEPLNDEEEVVYDNLNTHLRLGPKVFKELTPEQKFSAARVIHRQGYGVKEAHGAGDYLGIKFNHIFIGIEKDGYAHS